MQNLNLELPIGQNNEPRLRFVPFGTGDLSSLPARLNHSGDLSSQGELPETETAQFKLAKIAPRTPAPFAAIVLSDFKLRGLF